MFGSTIHPEESTLRDWMAGKLDESLSSYLEEHLRDCDECANKLDDMSVDHTFIERLRSAVGDADTAVEKLPNALRNGDLFFGVLALQTGLISVQQFADACLLLSIREDASLADILQEMHWVDDSRRKQIALLLEFRLRFRRHENEELSGIHFNGLHQQPLPTSPNYEKRLQLKHLHSSGGIGQVWLAHDTVLGRDVALKELKPEYRGSSSIRERFLREARISAQLSHPGTVPVYQYYQDDGTSYYTMRFLTGKTLSELIKEFHASRETLKSFEVTKRLFVLLEYFVKVCETIAYAHSQGIVHRDLNGSNIVVAEFGVVTVIDWGLAKQIPVEAEQPDGKNQPFDYSGTIQGERLGTPAYMAPEQIRGDIDQIDPRTDVYGLAALLYEILCGEAPFAGDTIHQIMHRAETEVPKRPREKNPDVAPELEAVCLKGLSKLREQRQQTSLDICEDVRNWIADQAKHTQTLHERERLFSFSTDLLIVLDEQGFITQVNPSWQRSLGWNSEETLGRNWDEFIHGGDHLIVRGMITELGINTPAGNVQTRMLCKEGSYRAVNWTVTKVPDEQVLYGIGRDLTEQINVEQRYLGLLDAAPDAMVVIDASRTIQVINRQTERLFGYRRNELVGQPVEVLLPERFKEGHPKLVEGYVRSPSVRPMGVNENLYARRKDGSEFQVEISLSPLHTAEGLLVTAAIRPVSR